LLHSDGSNYGCAGGDTEGAYGYVIKNGGIQLAASYPYVSESGTDSEGCLAVDDRNMVTVDVVKHVFDEESMVKHVLSVGPLSVCLDASTWDSYTNGVLHDCGHDPDHCVQIVGVNTQADENYWIVRNSWGTDWGVGGYVFLNLVSGSQ
jgi:C1A family cysteine protease